MEIRTALQNAAKELKSHVEARVLLSYATGHSLEYLISRWGETLSPEALDVFNALISRRKAHEPIAYIIGSKEFYGRDFVVSKDVLIPRCDSETLIDAALADFKDKLPSILELGVGSGCLAITLLLEIPNSKAKGADISDAALAIAHQNSQQHNVDLQLVKSDWFENMTGKYDIIISNPPYISRSDTDKMARETLQYEPDIALYAENNGLAAYEIIAENAAIFLKPNGKIYLEIGYDQEKSVKQIFAKNGLKAEGCYQDLSGVVRVLCFAKY